MPDIKHSQVLPDVYVIEVSGQIIMGPEGQRVEKLIDELIHEGRKKVVFDLSNLTHIDSTGVGILVTSCGRMTAAGAELRLAALRPRVSDVMRVAKLDRIITFYPTVASATENFTSASSNGDND